MIYSNNYISNQLSAGFGGDDLQGIMNSIKRIYRLLDNMSKNTAEYSAVSAGGKSSRAAQDYVEQIATDYMGAKEDYNKIFSSTELQTGKAKEAFKEDPKENKKLTRNLITNLVMEALKNENL